MGAPTYDAETPAAYFHPIRPERILHRRTPENVDRLLALLLRHGAYHRLD